MLLRLGFIVGFITVLGCSSADSTPQDAGRDADPSDSAVDSALDVDASDGSTADAASDAGTATTIGGGMIAVGDMQVPYELVRVPRGDGGHTYVQWVHSLEAGRRPVVVMTQPYDGIDWTGENVDTQLANASARSDGFFADEACAEANDDGIFYVRVTPEQAATSTVGYLMNGHAVMLAYGRYYACDDLDGDIADMRAALDYVATRPDADPAHVGIIGGSWGGFLALYGAADAPSTIRFDAIVALNPPSDFESWINYVNGLSTTWPAPDALAFFESYKRRVLRATGGAPGVGDFTRFEHGALCDAIGSTPTLLLHDEWDTLVPLDQSERFVNVCNKDRLWWPRQGPVDPEVVGLAHGLLEKEPGYASVFTFSQVYLLTRMNDAQHLVIALADQAAIDTFLGLLHDEQAAGGDVSWALPRLREAVATNVYFYLVTEMQSVEGANVIADAINLHWGTSLDANGLRTQLATALPAL